MLNVVTQPHDSQQCCRPKYKPTERLARKLHQTDTSETARNHNARTVAIRRRLHMGRAVIGRFQLTKAYLED
jgi:hypothetical protein